MMLFHHPLPIQHSNAAASHRRIRGTNTVIRQGASHAEVRQIRLTRTVLCVWLRISNQTQSTQAVILRPLTPAKKQIGNHLPVAPSSSSSQSTALTMRMPSSVTPSLNRSSVSTVLGNASASAYNGRSSRFRVDSSSMLSVTWMYSREAPDAATKSISPVPLRPIVTRYPRLNNSMKMVPSSCAPRSENANFKYVKNHNCFECVFSIY